MKAHRIQRSGAAVPAPPSSSLWRRALCWTAFFFALGPVNLAGAYEHFPVFPAIQANVAFWEDVYGRYTTRQAILHDARDLHLVYEVIDLLDPSLPGAGRINEQRVNQAKERLANLFDALASGVMPRTAREKRIARLFSGKPRQACKDAQERLRVQLGQKDRFTEGVIRSGKYMSFIKNVLSAENLPLDLAYLPHVESSFQVNAGSKAGAYGLWQFTRSTGKDYLTINSLVDERFDPYLSTRAAATFLKENYDALGDWPLALTAYNYGRAGMARAQSAYGSYEAIFKHYNEGYFKFASRNFYSEFLAAVKVAKRVEQSGLRLAQPEAASSYRLQHEASLAALCAKHKVSRAAFIKLNPALQAPVISGKRKAPANALVRLPASGNKPRATAAQAKRPAAQASGPATLPNYRYTVRQGDTLSGIATRFGVSREALLRVNNKGPHNPVRVGDQLKIPAKRSDKGAR